MELRPPSRQGPAFGRIVETTQGRPGDLEGTPSPAPQGLWTGARGSQGSSGRPATRDTVQDGVYNILDGKGLSHTRKNPQRQKKMGCGHVAPSCARRCAGSRLPDHARCSCFVRSRHHARMRPRRAIRLSAGSMWRAHQHSHIHVWPRTTFNKGGQEAGQQRGRHQQRIF